MTFLWLKTNFFSLFSNLKIVVKFINTSFADWSKSVSDSVKVMFMWWLQASTTWPRNLKLRKIKAPVKLLLSPSQTFTHQPNALHLTQNSKEIKDNEWNSQTVNPIESSMMLHVEYMVSSEVCQATTRSRPDLRTRPWISWPLSKCPRYELFVIHNCYS